MKTEFDSAAKRNAMSIVEVMLTKLVEETDPGYINIAFSPKRKHIVISVDNGQPDTGSEMVCIPLK